MLLLRGVIIGGVGVTQGMQPKRSHQGGVSVTVLFYFSSPSEWYKKRRKKTTLTLATSVGEPVNHNRVVAGWI